MAGAMDWLGCQLLDTKSGFKKILRYDFPQIKIKETIQKSEDIEKNENFAVIVDMHQDIVIPQHSERDKDVAGIPSAFTNVT